MSTAHCRADHRWSQHSVSDCDEPASSTRMGDLGDLESQGCFQGMAWHPSPGRPKGEILSHSLISLREIFAMA